MTKQELLSSLDFGQRVAEDEGEVLSAYFVETDHWRRLFNGDIDIIYGPKGSGKSALYSLLIAKTDELFDRNVLLVPGENPRGTPAFKELVADPPATELEFVNLWKLYFLSLLSASFTEFGVSGHDASRLREILAREGLAERSQSLQARVSSVFDYVKRVLRPASVDGGVDLDPVTQMPRVTGRIVFAEPSARAREAGVHSIDNLLALANRALASDARFQVWILLDRLDVAFVESAELEQNALRALFRAYLDMAALEAIKLKVFLRTDIWNRITRSGFREASHITRHVTISWDRSSLLNLIVRRVLHNEPLADHFGVLKEVVLGDSRSQEEFFYKVFPDQVDIGPNKPVTLDWLLSRTRDGTQLNAPRELIHFLSSLRTQQMRRYEIGEPEPDGAQLFSRSAFKPALPEVSQVRLEQTLYAEYPELRRYVDLLRGERTSQRPSTLAGIWQCELPESLDRANELVSVGFFERRGTRESPEYWVPFLYRDALGLVQGAAEESL